MNPQEKENRAENRDEKNREDKRKEKTDKPSRLGKEAKIGVAVILVLLITFGVVVVMRLTKSDADGDAVASTANVDDGKHKPGGSKDELFGDLNAHSFGNHPATVIPPAKDAATNPVGSGGGRWQLPADKTEPKPVGNRYAMPNSLGGELPKGPAAGRYDPLAGELPKGPPAGHRDPFAGDSPKEKHANPYDLTVGDPPRGLDADKPGRLGKKPNELPLERPDAKKPGSRADAAGLVTTRETFEHGEPSGYGAAGAPPAHHGRSRDEGESAALLPLPRDDDRPSHNGGGNRSYAAGPASPYDDDIASEPAKPPRDFDKSPRDFDRPPHRDPASFVGQPPLRDDGKYEVQPGDNYSKISQTVYGTSAYFKALAEQNRGKIGNEDRLTPGELISTPPVEQLVKSFPDSCPKASRRETQESRIMNASTQKSYRGGRAYTVAEGDTLFNIARYELGKASRWAEIYEMNRDVLGKDYNYLTPGMQLVLPGNEKSDMLTRRSGDLLK